MSDLFVDFFADKTSGNPITGASLVLSGNITKDMTENQIPFNLEGQIFISLAYVASLVPGSTIVKQFKSIDELVVTARYPRGFVLELTTDTKEVIRDIKGKNGGEPTFLNPRDVADNFGDYNLANANNCADTESRSLLSIVVSGHNTWKTWFLDLLGASQVVKLTGQHVRSYCAWKDTPDIDGNFIASNFPKLKGGMPAITPDNDLRSMLSDGEWIKYRTTFATSTGLLAKMIRECPKEFLIVFSGETISIINRANSEYWSEKAYRAIPTKALGILYAYLMATDQMEEGLWGPKRAYDDLTVAEKESLSNWFKDAKSKLVIYKGGLIAGNLPSSITGV